MGPHSYNIMKWAFSTYLPDKELNILDIGSCDENPGEWSTYRNLVTNPRWRYTGLDIHSGRNVDIVGEPYKWPIEDNYYDVVISGQVLEHVEDIYAWADEAIRVLKPGGNMFIIAPSRWSYHAYPVDCWRFYPDGYRFLFIKRTHKMQEVVMGEYENHSYAIMKKTP